MEMEQLHGYGTGGKLKFVKFTVSLTEPTPTELDEIWIKSNSISPDDIYFNESDPSLGTNDVLIGIGNKGVVYPTSTLDRGKKHCTLPTDASYGRVYIKTDYFNLCGYYTVCKLNISGTVTTMDAYYWNGSSWIQFSYVDEVFVYKARISNEGTPYFKTFNASTLSGISDYIIRRTSGLYTFCRYDEQRGLYIFTNSTQIIETDTALNIVRTLTYTSVPTTFGGTVGGTALGLFYKNGVYYKIQRTGDYYIQIVNMSTDEIVYTSTQTITTFALNKMRFDSLDQYCYTGGYNNGSDNVSHFMLDLTNFPTSVALSTFTSGVSSYSHGMLVNKTKIILVSSSGGYIVLTEKNLANSSTIKTVTTDLSATVLNELIGNDAEGNYYFYNGSYAITKVNSNGDVVWTSLTHTSDNSPIFTFGEKIIIDSTTTLYRISTLDGSRAVSTSVSYGYSLSLFSPINGGNPKVRG